MHNPITKQKIKQIAESRLSVSASQLNMLHELAAPENREKFAAVVDPPDFYKIGKILAKGNNPELIVSYLDIFRSSNFLRRIYEDERWPDLILDLVRIGNYTFPVLFRQRITKYPRKPLFTLIQGAKVSDVTWSETAAKVVTYTRGLLSLLSGPDQEKSVAFFCKNSLDMALLDLACLTGGIVNIMIPANSVPPHIEYILNLTRPAIMVFDNRREAEDVFRQIRRPEFIKYILVIQENEKVPHPFLTLQALSDSARSVPESAVIQKSAKVNLQDLATIMFTSGTTGNPKGIMFSQQNIVFKRFARAMALPEIGENDVFLSYLPLYHTFGRWLEMTGCIFWNARYVFMENPSAEAMLANMRKIRPTVFISIPKKWVQLYEEITKRIDIVKSNDEEIDKVVKRTTGGRLKWGLSAAGHLDSDIFEFFQRYGISLMSGFGMTEATGGITMTPPGKYRPNSLGKALPGITIKIEEDGELLIKGPYVMMGYFNPEESAVQLSDGWLATGDIMRMSDDGFIEIIDRKKEIYKNIRGETIAPQKIENFFRDFEFIKHVFLVGDGRPYNCLLVYPDYTCKDIDFKNMNAEEIRAYFSSVVVSVNRFLAPFERIVDFAIIDRDFQSDKDELTPKGTYRRKVIERNFSDYIDPMYRQSFLSLKDKKVEINLPHWFLRECGITADEVTFSNNKLVVAGESHIRRLTISKSARGVRVGQIVYKVKNLKINLEQIITSPHLWVGNHELIEFTGMNIFHWKRNQHSPDTICFGHGVLHNSHISAADYASDDDEAKLFQVHHNAFLLFSRDQRIRHTAATGLIEAKGRDALLTRQILQRCSTIDDLKLQRYVFTHLLHDLADAEFKDVVYAFLSGKRTLIDRSIIHHADRLRLSEPKLHDLMEVTVEFYRKKDRRAITLMKLLASYAAHHPTSFQVIRQFIVNCQLGDDSQPELNADARKAQLALREGFRRWLGPNQRVAVDVESGAEYTWDDVLTFEEGIPKEDLDRLKGTIQNTSMIREAIFLFSRGILVRLNDVPPGGVWVSLLGKRHGKAVYRVTIQTRFHGSFDIAVNLNKDLQRDDVIEETNWLIQAGTAAKEEKLVEDFGGYWPEYDLWSEEFIPGETAGKFIHRLSRRTNESDINRLKLLWPFFIWSAATVYISFWVRTGRRLQLRDPNPDNVIVPSHDYQTGSRIVSISARKKHRKLDDLLMGLYKNFIVKTEQQYPELRGIGKPKYIFSAFLEALGTTTGLQLLENCRKKMTKESCKEIKQQLIQYMDAVVKFGYMPKQLYFAIKRYQRWYELNSEATIQARAATLSELYDTYELYRLETEYPETRTRFFTNTILNSAKQDLKDRLESIIFQQRQKKMDANELAQQIAAIQQDVNPSEEEIFFLTRLSYPHLKPTDSADLIATQAGGKTRTDLVVQAEDYDGNSFWIRTPVNPKEISRLHNLFVTNNLPVQFLQEHKYLIAVNERGHLIGGLFYKHQDEGIVHMEKIVVADFYRKKGVSDGVLTEFFSRMHDEHVRYVTTGFFRPEYFYRFGFKTERKYAGLVKQI